MTETNGVTMMDIEQGDPERGFTFYTYAYGDDLEKCACHFYGSVEEVHQDLVALRTVLIAEEGREEPLRDMTIVRLRTLPVTLKSLVELFNGINGDLGGFIRSREVVEVVSEPQVVSNAGRHAAAQ